MVSKQLPIPAERIEGAILLIRGEKVLLDKDLALLYGVSTSVLNNKEVRQITHFDRFQTIRLMKELIAENPDIQKPGRGRNARYAFVAKI